MQHKEVDTFGCHSPIQASYGRCIECRALCGCGSCPDPCARLIKCNLSSCCLVANGHHPMVWIEGSRCLDQGEERGAVDSGSRHYPQHGSATRPLLRWSHPRRREALRLFVIVQCPAEISEHACRFDRVVQRKEIMAPVDLTAQRTNEVGRGKATERVVPRHEVRRESEGKPRAGSFLHDDRHCDLPGFTGSSPWSKRCELGGKSPLPI